MSMTDPLALFLERVAEHPDHPAVIEGESVTTYGELERRAQSVAAAVRKAAEAPRVAIHMPSGAAAFGAMFGTLMAGGVYAPVNVAAPESKRRQLIEVFGPDVILAGNGGVPNGAEQPLVLDIDDLPDAVFPGGPREGGAAYVIFTSGSTGVPKGVAVGRAALGHFVEWALTSIGAGPGDRWSQHPNIGFDLSVLDIYGALCSGATLVPLSASEARLTPALAIRRHALSIWNSVPSVVGLMMRARQLTRENLASLRMMTFCGEPLLPEHLLAIFDARPDLRVDNTYGPTEATVSCSQRILGSHDYHAACGASVAVGDPIPGMTFVLAGGRTPDEGELVIAGPQLAMGYWGDRESTARAFRPIDTPHGPMRGYWTGDWMVRDGGELFFRGRIDNQVKISGHRLELDEVCAALRHQGFDGAHCILAKGVLHAFLEGEPADDTLLAAALAEDLEAYAIPAHYHFMAVLPRTENGKIDGEALARRCVGE